MREVSSNPAIFSSEPKGPWHVTELRFSMEAMDGKAHLRDRNVVSRAFTRRMVSMLSDRAVRYADEAIDAFEGRRNADFVTDLAVPVPMRIIADMLGVPVNRPSCMLLCARLAQGAVSANGRIVSGMEARASGPSPAPIQRRPEGAGARDITSHERVDAQHSAQPFSFPPAVARRPRYARTLPNQPYPNLPR